MSRNFMERMSFRHSSRREQIPHERLRDTSPRPKLSFIGRMGLCICMIQELRGGGIKKMCHVCAPKKIEKIEDEFRDMFDRNMTVVCFFEKPTHSQFWPIMVFDNTSGILALELLAVTVQKTNKFEYGIVERWMNYNCHRVVEDHELILDVVKEQKMLGQATGRFQFGYEKNTGKYNFIDNKEKYFIHYIQLLGIDFTVLRRDPQFIRVDDLYLTNRAKNAEKITAKKSGGGSREVEIDLEGDINPVYCSTVYVKQHDDYPTIDDIERRGKKDQSEFEKKFLLVRKKNLYFVNSHQNMLKFYYEDDPLFLADRMRDAERVQEERILTHIAHLADIQCYTMENVSKYYDTDFKVACLIKSRDPLFGRTIRLIFCCKSIRNDEKEADVIARWVAAIRVARDGTRLKKNYFAIRMLVYGGDARLKMPVIQKNKILQDLGYKLDQADPRVAMDFSKGIGRIVQDPAEAAEIARSEKRSQNITAERQEASSSSGIISAPIDVMRFGPHLTQKYYHGSEVSRSKANAILKRANCPGSYLLRDSSTEPGMLVISYMCATEVKHVFVVPIVQIDDETGDHMYLVSCDGKLLFYNVHSLIDFHKLNLMPPFKLKLQQCVPNPDHSDSSPKRNRRTFRDRELADESIGIKQENIRRALTFNITGTTAAIADLLERSRIGQLLSDERRSASPTIDEAQMLDLSLNEPSGSGMSRQRPSPPLSPLVEVPSSGDSDSPPRM